MVISNYTMPPQSSFQQKKIDNSDMVVKEKISEVKEKSEKIEIEDKKESKTAAADRGKIIQKTNINIETKVDYSTYNIKKQVDEQSHLLSDSPNRQTQSRHDFLGKNLSILV